MNNSLTDRLKGASHENSRHQFDVGHYWNLCEDALAEIERLQRGLIAVSNWHIKQELKFENKKLAIPAVHRIASRIALRHLTP